MKCKKSDGKFWDKALAQVLIVITFLSSQQLAFRGSNELADSLQNGTFLESLELLAECDTFLAECHE